MEQINLNIIPDGAMPVCHASQFDKNRTIRFNLNQNGSVYTLAGTETITCKVRKPDDTESTINVANTSSSYVDVTFGFSDTDLSGYAMCELKIVNGAQTTGSRNFLLNVEADAYDGSVFEERSASGAIASFKTNFIDNLTECIVDIDAVQAGSGVPSTTNVRAISGRSACNLTKCGKNLSYANNASFTSGQDKTEILQPEIFLKAGTYTFSFTVSASITSTRNRPMYRTSSGANIYAPSDYNSSGRGSWTFTLSTDSIISLRWWCNNPSTSVTISDFQLEPGTTATSFEEYNGGTDTISLGQTVYGGTLNVTTGLLTITHGYIEFDGSEHWGTGGTNQGYYVQLNSLAKLSNYIGSMICNKLDVFDQQGDMGYKNASDGITAYIDTYNTYPDQNWIYAKASGCANVNDFKTWLSNNNLVVVYELATPTEIQLTPTEVRTLLNDNNIFADTGDIEVKYLIEVV